MVARSVVRSMFILYLGNFVFYHEREVLVGEAEGDQVPQGEQEGDQVPQGERERDQVPQGEPEGEAVEAEKVLQVKKTKELNQLLK